MMTLDIASLTVFLDKLGTHVRAYIVTDYIRARSNFTLSLKPNLKGRFYGNPV